MRTVKEIWEEIHRVEEDQGETEFGSVGWDFYNAELVGLHAELKEATLHWDRLKLTGMLGVDIESG